MILGLTGGIASGKSTASEYFMSKGIPVIDADKIAREVVLPGKPALQKLEETFGPDILKEDGQLNRLALAGFLFSSKEDRQLINDIMQPYIRESIEEAASRLVSDDQPLIVVDIPLLYEQNYQEMVDLVMVIAVDEDTQMQRLIARDQLTTDQAKKRILSQMPIAAKKLAADIVIDNEGTREEMYRQIDQWLDGIE